MAEEEIHITKFCRKGKDRFPSTHVEGVSSDKKPTRFRSKVAHKNYELAMPRVMESDKDLMVRSFVRCQADTRQFRRQRQQQEVIWRGKSMCYKARWLKDFLYFDGDECLFFPSFVINRPEKVKYNFKTIAAARAMLLMTQGLSVNSKHNMATHICGNGHLSCVNPKHVIWGCAASNAQDRIVHSENRKFVAGMDEDLIDAIRSDGRLCKVIAWETEIPASVINGIKTGELWAGPTA